MKKVIVLGAGMVGSAMAMDLTSAFEVTVSDFNPEALNGIKEKNQSIKTVELDVTNKTELQNVLAPFDLVVCAVPGFLGYSTLQTIIECQKDVVDISFFPENALGLNELAKQKNVTAIVDCGVAPGMGNVILGYHNETMEITDFLCLVGGLPIERKWPFCYKAPFSPIDVIEEYTRPARYIENNQLITKPAMSDCEYIHFDKAGTLEAFNTDGLRSIIHTMPHIPNRKEKTLRFPGHIEYIKVLKESGFFNEETILINGKEISPKEFTCKILFSEWKLGQTEKEFTIMRVSVSGTENGKSKSYTYTLYDEFDPETGVSSMARTTGYTATAAVHLIDKGLFTEKGVFPPELVGKHQKCFDHFLGYLKDRNVIYKRTEKNQGVGII